MQRLDLLAEPPPKAPTATFARSMPVAAQKTPKVRSATSLEWPTRRRPSRSFGARTGPAALTAMVEGEALNIA